MSTQPTQPIALFYSCAQNSQDQALLTQLDSHLTPLKQAGLITPSLHKGKLLAGSDTAQETLQHLNTAQIILLLISPDYLPSCESELQRAMERYSAHEAHVIPILLRPGYYEHAPFAHLKALPANRQAVTSWSNPDEAFTEITQEISKVIQQLNPNSSHSSSISPATQPIFHVPYPRNPFFTGREQLLKQLRRNLTANKTAALTQAQAINGLGGIGKTSIAVEYAYRYRANYRYVLWVTATSDSIINDFVKFAELLNLREKNAQDATLVVAAVQQWLTRQDGWLLILDNADDIDMVANFLPPTYRGHILLTTRAQAVGSLAQSSEVENMADLDGVLLLLRRAKVLAPTDKLHKAAEPDRRAAEALVAAVDGLPLALDQAGAYIEETGCSISAYLDSYQQRQAALLKRRGGVRSDHPDPVATTWSLSFEQVETTSPLAADLLRLCAFLAPDAIPEELFTEGAPQLGPQLQALADAPTLLDEALAVLRRYSLIRRDNQTRTLSIHLLVQAVLKERMPQDIQQQWAERTVRALAQAFPANIDIETWPQCKRYIGHAQTCVQFIDHYQLAFPEAAYLLSCSGYYLNAHARYDEAEPLYKRALAIYEQLLGSLHPNTLSSLNNLAALYYRQGRLKEAEPLYKRALAIDEQVSDSLHLDTAGRFNNLAALYHEQGRYDEAEPLYRRALTINEQQLGSLHPHTATGLNNLAKLYREQGRLEEAEPLYERALAILEQHLDPLHPYLASSLNNLALLYKDQGRLDEAEPLYRRAVAIMEKVLPDHPNMPLFLKNYARLLRAIEREEEAVELEGRAEAIRGRLGL